MDERGKEMSTPEQWPKVEGQGEEQKSSFEKKIEDLINPPEGKEKVIKNDDLRRLALSATKPWNQSPERLNDLLKTGSDWYLDPEKKISEEEWGILAGLIYREKSQLEVEQLKKTPPTVSLQGPAIDFESLINKISEGQEKLLQAWVKGQITLEQFLQRSQKPTQDLADSLRRVSPREERERWVDVEYRQEFWTSFTPSMEPRFYTELSGEERRLFDARWRLARAAYVKKVTVASPEDMVKNQELILLSMEQMEKLYNIPGVKDALSWYAQKIVLDKTFWDCKNEIEFEQIRKEMRESIKKNTKGIKEEKNKEEQDRLAKDADAVAWNWIWVSNLVESADSRYSKGASGGRHDGLPGVLASDDLRAVFHSQEKFENKCTKRQEWGAFGKWGITQIELIRNLFSKDKDEFRLVTASGPSEFWSAIRIKEPLLENDKLKEKGEVVIKVPECYPTTSMGSFWEEINFEDNQGKKTPLLNFLLSNKEINWRELKSAFWVDYLPIKLNKAVQLLKYFKGEVPFEEEKDKAWVAPILDVYRRLDLEKKLGEKSFHNLKSWTFRASLGGVRKPQEKFTDPILVHYFAAYAIRLRNPRLGYLKTGTFGDWTGEGLDIR